MRGESTATASGFHTTHWTVVLSARDPNDPLAHEAIASLLSTYWYPLYAFIRRTGATPHDAEDLTQEFVRHLLQRNVIERVDRNRGKFRSFLLACLKNFLANERERAQAQRRGGGQSWVPLDAMDAQNRYALEPSDQRTPEALFERRWALAILERTINDLRREYAKGGKADLFDSLRDFLPGGELNGSRAEMASRFGMTVGALDVAIHRLRQRFGTLLRYQVAQTVSCEADVDEELRYLIALLSGSVD